MNAGTSSDDYRYDAHLIDNLRQQPNGDDSDITVEEKISKIVNSEAEQRKFNAENMMRSSSFHVFYVFIY